MARRGSSGRSFVIAVDKPAGMTSHDVVNRCRRAFGERRIGHFGTLDPLAQGVMLLGVGSAARLDRYLVEHDKSYVARIVFGEERASDDGEGSVIERRPVPACVADPVFAEDTLASFTGPQLQVPPVYSAIKHGGVASHVRARQGQEVAMEARPIQVYEAKLLACDQASWTVSFRGSRGTYVRALARDLGRAVGCGAYLGGLLRDTLGDVTLAECASLDDLAAPEAVRRVDPVRLLGFPVVSVPATLASSVANGNPLPVSACGFDAATLTSNQAVCLVEGTCLRGISRYDASAQLLRCECLFSPGVERG